MAIGPFPFEVLPRLTAEAIAAGSALQRHLGPSARGALARWAVECLGREPSALEVIPTEVSIGLTAERAAAIAAAERFALQGARGSRVTLALDQRLAASCVAAILRAPRAAGAVGEAERGLLAFGLAWLIGELERTSWVVLEERGDLAVDSIVVEAGVRIGERRGFAWLLLPRELLMDPSPPRPRPLRRLGGLNVVGAVELGRCRLSIDEVQSLGPGDTIISPSWTPSAEPRQVALRVGRGRFICEVEAGRLTVLESYTRGAPMTRETERGMIAEQLEVELVAEIGRIELTVADVMELGVGDVIGLRRGLTSPLDLRVGDKLVGRGELVDVDGEVGVRLLEVYD